MSAESGTGRASPTGGPFLYQEYLNFRQPHAAGGHDLRPPGSGWGNRALFFGGGSGSGSFYESSLLVELNRLPAPPPGMHYQSYLAAVSPTGVGSFVPWQHDHAGCPRKRDGPPGSCAGRRFRVVHPLSGGAGAGRHRTPSPRCGCNRATTTGTSSRTSSEADAGAGMPQQSAPAACRGGGRVCCRRVPGTGARCPGTCPGVIDSLRCGNWRRSWR